MLANLLRVAGPTRCPLPPIGGRPGPSASRPVSCNFRARKSGMALADFLALLRFVLRLLPLFVLLFRSALVPRHAGPKSAEGESGFLRRRLRLPHVTQPRPFRCVLRLPHFLNADATAFPIHVRDRLLICAPGCGRILPRHWRRTPRLCRRGSSSRFPRRPD